jgi:FMN phosphatase YigB (HAD superfamily)
MEAIAMKHYLTRFFYVLLLFLCATEQAATFIFDLDGVLIQKSTMTVIWESGPTNFLLNPFKATQLRQTLFSFLDLVEERRPETPFACSNGKLLPQIMCDWLDGTKDCKTIRTLIKQKIKSEEDFFATYGCKSAITGLTKFMFNPKKFAQSISILKKGKKLAKQCKAAGHKIYVLSNFDRESFEYLSERPSFKKLFSLFDGVCISGVVGKIKPDPAIFHELFSRWDIDTTQTIIYLDDEPCNIEGAQNLRLANLHAVLIKDGSYSDAYDRIKELNIEFL